MVKTLLLLILVIMTGALAFSATPSSDGPELGETFASFFARITRGGGFRGIYIHPTAATQEAFLKKIKKGYWVGLNDQAKGQLIQKGVDIWGDWYRQEFPFQVILNNPQKADLLNKILAEQIQKDQSECAPTCPSSKIILDSQWQNLDSFSKQAFVKAFVLKGALFNGKALVQILGDIYHFPSEKVLASTRIRILSHAQFVSAVRELGYEGEVYFRGITAPDPKNSQGHVIFLDEEQLFKYSPFDRPVLKTLEVIGILTHELSHVFQDLKGQSLGYDVQVRSAEAALLIEGSAEYLAEMAMTQAAQQETFPSALGLFVTEQAVEIVYREGNESSGNLFPYTVGLPFAAALYDQVTPARHEQLTQRILEFLGQEASLQEWLQQDFLK